MCNIYIEYLYKIPENEEFYVHNNYFLKLFKKRFKK